MQASEPGRLRVTVVGNSGGSIKHPVIYMPGKQKEETQVVRKHRKKLTSRWVDGWMEEGA